MVSKTKQAETKKLPAGRQPEIDLSEMSYDDALKMAVLEAKINRLAMLQERMNKGETTPEFMDELLQYTSPEMMEEVFDAVRKQMANVVRWLPEDWFVPDTPPGLSLRDPETYRWLRADKSKVLRTLIQQAQQSASKNSEGG
ncbi:MAG: hypothetical protein E6Q97_30555 [Desulfurellales bacterium]|nr:MAG: hypothetical protein E6Q97_30555 [Desulfurellales bacterium]